jgi:hypothetical protein
MHESGGACPGIRERVGKKYDMMTWPWSCGETIRTLAVIVIKVETDLNL